MLSRSNLAIIALLLMMAGAALAAPVDGEAAALSRAEEDPAPAALTAQADLVFRGKVTDITYASSTDRIPHTFVTYSVDEVLKGSYHAASLTLRFIGGERVDGPGLIRRLIVSHAPRFAMGQQDVLMVRGNNSEECPLVQCAKGRFRLVDDHVVTEEGSPLSVEDLRIAERGERSTRSAFELPDGSQNGAETGTAVDTRMFVDHLREAIRGQSKAAAPAAVNSANPWVPFKGPDMVAAPGPRDPAASSPGRAAETLSQNEHDRQEVEALRRNGGNPVLPEPPR